MPVQEDLDCETEFETRSVQNAPFTCGSINCSCTCHNSTDKQFCLRNKHCISCETKFIQLVKEPRPASSGNSTIEQNKCLSVSPVGRSKRQFETASPSKILPVSPNKIYYVDSEKENHCRTQNLKSSPKNIRLEKLSKNCLTVRKLSLKSKCTISDNSVETDSSTPVDDLKIVSPKNCTQKQFNPQTQLNPNESQKKEDSSAKVSSNQKMLIIDDSHSLNTTLNGTTHNLIADTEPEPMEWDDYNASVESITLRLSPSLESIDLIETSQDLSESNLVTPVTCSENDDLMEDIESIHSECSSPNQLSEERLSLLKDALPVNKICDSVVDSIVNTIASWTRGEDKVLLETFQKECDNEDIFKIISDLLPQRTIPEIRDRFQTLMNLLLQINDSC